MSELIHRSVEKSGLMPLGLKSKCEKSLRDFVKAQLLIQVGTEIIHVWPVLG